MNRFLILLSTALVIAMLVGSCSGNNDQLYEELEYHLSRRQEVTALVENRLDSIKRCLDRTTDDERRYALCDTLVEQYMLFNSDSALKYIAEALEISRRLKRSDYEDRISIENAYILATSGHYSYAKSILEHIDKSRLDNKATARYYESWRWLYNTWEVYANEDVMAKEYAHRGAAYLDTLCMIIPETTAEGLYFNAERQALIGNLKEAEKLYLKCIDRLDRRQRRYASATCALAMVYETQNRSHDFEHYIILSAISDQIIPLKENYALQLLAKYLANNQIDYPLAQRYLIYSVEDAIYYNNRLRLTEIARKLPKIARGYQEENEAQNVRDNVIIAIIGLLALGLLCIVIFSVMQNRKLRAQRRMRIALNERLKATNRNREQNVSLFIELCAAYIDKYNKFHKSIERKVKAHNTDDLLTLLHSSRLKDTDAKEFFAQFDLSFVSLYPQFVAEFNALLLPEYRIELKKDQLLNSELRIMALLRLGVKDTNRIATLLQYSPQTIYNYRSSLKSHAIDKENFEENVAMLCEVN